MFIITVLEKINFTISATSPIDYNQKYYCFKSIR